MACQSRVGSARGTNCPKGCTLTHSEIASTCPADPGQGKYRLARCTCATLGTPNSAVFVPSVPAGSLLPLQAAPALPSMSPQYTLGGVVLTRTCSDCNDRGALAEAELLRWWAQAYPARFATPGLPGSRVGGDVLLRTTTNGKFALVVRGGAGAGVHDVPTTAGLTEDVTASLSLATGAWMVALLKSAYLAACVHLREVPRTRDAQCVREIVRAGAFGTDPPVVGSGNDSVPFRVFRIYNATAAQARGVWMGVAFLPRAGDPVPIFGVGLGAVAFVTWPVPDLRQRAVRLALGKPTA